MMQPSGQASATTVPIGSDADLAWVRQQVRQCAAALEGDRDAGARFA